MVQECSVAEDVIVGNTIINCTAFVHYISNIT